MPQNVLAFLQDWEYNVHDTKFGGITLKELAQIASAVQASSTMAIDALAKQMKAEGVDVVGFGAGEPDFNTPDHIKAAAVQAIANNVTDRKSVV